MCLDPTPPPRPDSSYSQSGRGRRGKWFVEVFPAFSSRTLSDLRFPSCESIIRPRNQINEKILITPKNRDFVSILSPSFHDQPAPSWTEGKSVSTGNHFTREGETKEKMDVQLSNTVVDTFRLTVSPKLLTGVNGDTVRLVVFLPFSDPVIQDS